MPFRFPFAADPFPGLFLRFLRANGAAWLRTVPPALALALLWATDLPHALDGLHTAVFARLAFGFAMLYLVVLLLMAPARAIGDLLLADVGRPPAPPRLLRQAAWLGCFPQMIGLAAASSAFGLFAFTAVPLPVDPFGLGMTSVQSWAFPLAAMTFSTIIAAVACQTMIDAQFVGPWEAEGPAWSGSPARHFWNTRRTRLLLRRAPLRAVLGAGFGTTLGLMAATSPGPRRGCSALPPTSPMQHGLRLCSAWVRGPSSQPSPRITGSSSDRSERMPRGTRRTTSPGVR